PAGPSDSRTLSHPFLQEERHPNCPIFPSGADVAPFGAVKEGVSHVAHWGHPPVTWRTDRRCRELAVFHFGRIQPRRRPYERCGALVDGLAGRRGAGGGGDDHERPQPDRSPLATVVKVGPELPDNSRQISASGGR